ncbi:exodeoxyribonuclease VII large subunit [Caldicoprobacter algeriensis]|uniref:exodeoxyribonuclease VII large subunit n=1 Tax=Caldicoprobacter algeriensis TaxID=699281 RepID=UPI00207933DD|nr:exodeoxyribonuclease VII large subunit [Caldicoprobacter algeriensis]MCM8900888.1 exodeoxyribonuclease VII large subunit [Caldicoprobacter algeriensis]
MGRVIFSVHQINEYVRGLLGRDPILQDVWVRGEISNLKIHSSGHIYFTLKDEQDRIRCVLFRQNQRDMAFIPSDGMRVLVRGQVSLYCKDGQYQIYVMDIEKDGIGELYLAFEALKQRLKAEGLFDAQHKKPIPPFPRKIAVITSPTGAAVRDIIKVVRRRCPCVDILVVPVLVQGSAAPAQIEAALDYVNTRDDIDTIILGRGGGSLEELWAFNEEVVARAIWRSRIPVISAVGHETDFTIADFVADLRAPTPSAAAEMAVPMLQHLQEMLAGLNVRLMEAMRNMLLHKRKSLEHLQLSYVLRYPDRIMQQRRQQLDQAYTRLCVAFNDILSKKRERLSRLAAALDALSPLAVLGRGYAVVTLMPSERVVYSVTSLKQGDGITVHFKDGCADCRVEKIEGGVYGVR